MVVNVSIFAFIELTDKTRHQQSSNIPRAKESASEIYFWVDCINFCVDQLEPRLYRIGWLTKRYIFGYQLLVMYISTRAE